MMICPALPRGTPMKRFALCAGLNPNFDEADQALVTLPWPNPTPSEEPPAEPKEKGDEVPPIYF